MANELDETKDVTSEGRDVRVIDKQLPVKAGSGTKGFFNVACWFLLVIPGVVVAVKKAKAKEELQQIQQKIQSCASQLDNYLEQRVVILSNLAPLVQKAIDLDKDVMSKIAAYRSHFNPDDASRNEIGSAIEGATHSINVALEKYPELKAHDEIAQAIQQNSYLQKEITAAREQYNDAVLEWNRKIYSWPIYQLVADAEGYTTRIPFSTSKEIRDSARKTFF